MSAIGLEGHMPHTETTVKQAVLASASENSNLLVKLGETETAPEDLAQHQNHISRLRADVQEQKQILNALKDQVNAKFRIHKKYNDNVTRKILYRASFMLDKLETKAAAGEKEYSSVLMVQNQAEARYASLVNELGELEKAEPDFQRRAQEHGDAHEKIDELYESLFAGPTPGFPQEDSLENRFYVARGSNETVRQKIITARRAARVLKLALRSLARADRLLDDALFDARNSFFIFDEAARSLEFSNKHLDYALSSLLEASNIVHPKALDIEVCKKKAIHDLQLAKTTTKPLSNREAYATTTQTSKHQLIKSRGHIQTFIALTAERERTGLDEISKTARALEDSRQALHQSRMAIFEEVAGFGQAAPSYTECCDRADAFCELPPPPPAEAEEQEDSAFLSPVLPDYEDATGGHDDRVEGRRSMSPVEDGDAENVDQSCQRANQAA